MTAHRTPTLAVYALDGFRQAFARPTDPGTGVSAGLIALIAVFWNLHVVALIILVVAFGGVDLWTGSRRARINERLERGERYDRKTLDEGVEGKAAALILILFLGIAIDTLLSLAAGGLKFGTIFQTLTPVTAAMLAWRLAREMSSCVENYEATPGGEGEIWPGVKVFIDVLRFRLAHPTKGGMPRERWSDKNKNDVQTRAWLLKQLDELDELDVEPPPGDKDGSP